MKCLARLAAGWMAGVSVGALAADPPAVVPPTPQTQTVDVVRAASIRDWPRKNLYPRNEVADGREGWVVLTLRVDSDGRPYDPMVTGSSGNPAFEKAALQALDDMTFEPARRGGQAIDSRFSFKMKFAIDEPEKAASGGFVGAYKKFMKAIEARDKAAADSRRAQLKPLNLYEQAFAHMGHFSYHSVWGTPAEQLDDLKAAIAGEREPTYLPKSLFTTALFTKFKLEVEASDFGSALSTAELLEPHADPEMRQRVEKVVGQIRALQSGSDPVRTVGITDAQGSWNSQLLRNRFSVVVNTGSIRAVRLACARKFLTFKYEPGLEYTIGAAKDRCHVQLAGEPGSTFDFIQ
jgi:TonB family protein